MADRAEIDTLNRQSRASEVLTVTIVMLCLSTVFVVLRLISRFGIVKRISNDDYAIMLAWVGDCESPSASYRTQKTDGLQLIAFGFSFSICYGTSIGLGRHEANILGENRGSLRKVEYVFAVLYVGTRDINRPQ